MNVIIYNKVSNQLQKVVKDLIFFSIKPILGDCYLLRLFVVCSISSEVVITFELESYAL